MPEVTGSHYDEYYYAHNCGGLPYDASEAHWQRFFGLVADAVIRQLNPTTVLDVGCAKGFFVQALRERGVDAWGVDISEYAVGEAAESIRPYVAVSPIGKPLPEHFPAAFDLVSCIETAEHLPHDALRDAVRWLTTLSGRILFSASPNDFAEASHLSVLPPEEWSSLFAEERFYRNLDIDVRSLTDWAAVYERGTTHFPIVVKHLERHFLRADAERTSLRAEVLRLTDEVAGLTHRLDAGPEAARAEEQAKIAAERQGLQAQIDALRAALDDERHRHGENLADAQVALFAERDAVIGAKAEAAQAKRRADEQAAIAQDLAARLEPMMLAARQLELTMQSETWRIGNAIMAPLRVLRRKRPS